MDEQAQLVERRWFAALKRAETKQAECELLREVYELAHVNWRHAQTELAQLELLRDTLAREFEALHQRETLPHASSAHIDSVMTAA